jgi:hypothetical protein
VPWASGVGWPWCDRLRAAPENAKNMLDRLVNRLMLPDPHHRPACLLECGCLSPIALTRTADLGLPERPIGHWHLAMFRAAVPEAAIDEHRHASPRKDDVRSYSLASGNHPEILAKPQALPMQRRPKRHLWSRVAAGVGLHGRCRVRARGRSGQRSCRHGRQTVAA